MRDMFWSRENGPVLEIGFTDTGLKSLGKIWQFLNKVEPPMIINPFTSLAQIESTKCLKSLKIPFSGRLIYIEPLLSQFPEKISKNTVLFKLEQNNALPSV